jgi:Putative DnaT-like ssDNA binding protein
MALDAVAGSPTANSYCTVAAATAFMHERLDTDPWFDPPASTHLTLTATREAALIWATRLLDEQVRWYGVPATTTQALAWPQTGQVDVHGHLIDPSTVPVDIQHATATYALELMRATNAMASGGSSATGVKRRKIGDTEIEYFEGSATSAARTSPLTTIPPEVRAMLAPYGAARGGVNVPLLRV